MASRNSSEDSWEGLGVVLATLRVLAAIWAALGSLLAPSRALLEGSWLYSWCLGELLGIVWGLLKVS